MSEKVAVLKWVGAGAALMLAGAPLAGAQEAAVLDSVVITADQERADGPVQGYRAKRTRSATRTDTPIEEIPQSISVVPASVLDDLDSPRVERALDFAGGVARQNDFGGLTMYEYSVRGLTTSEFYKDGFSVNRGYMNPPDAASIERVEVLKGPSASLYGRGDPGGTINIVSKRPQLDSFARLDLSAGRWDRYRSALDVNTPLDEDGNMLYRMNIAVEDNKSFRDHRESERQFVAPAFSWELSPDTRLLVQAEVVRNRQTSIEHQLLIGTEYERYALSEFMLRSNNLRTIDLYNPVYGAPRPAFNPARTVDRNELVHNRALNLQDQMRLTDKLFGVVGARYDHYEQRLDNEVSGRRAEQTHEKITPRVGVLYQLLPEVGLFANASQSFKPNNGAAASGATFDPEEGMGYEAGVKLDLFDGRLGLTAAAFHLTKENVLTSDPANDGFQIAAGEVRSRGIDLQLAGQLTDEIRVIGGYAYVDAEVTRDNTLASGSRLLNVPRHSGSLLTTYEFLDGDLSGLSLGGAVNYVGDRAGQADSDFELPSYTTVDLLARYKATEKLTLGMYLNNAFDRTYYERSYSDVWVMPGEPRNLSVSLSVEL